MAKPIIPSFLMQDESLSMFAAILSIAANVPEHQPSKFPAPRQRAHRSEGQVSTCKNCRGNKIIYKTLDAAGSYPGIDFHSEPCWVQCYPCGGSGYVVRVKTGKVLPGYQEVYRI